jgi:PAS domain S-box-containing protein
MIPHNQTEPPADVALRGDEQYRLLLESVTDCGIFLVDTGGHVAAWNVGAERLFGYPQEEILGQPWARFFTPEDREQGEPDKQLQAAATQGQASVDRWHLRKDGTRFWAHSVTTALRDEHGRLRGFAKLTRDRTEHLAAQKAVAASEHRKYELLAMLAHELRTPLAPIRNALQVMRLRGRDRRHTVSWARDMMERQLQRLTRLLENLLDVSRIRRGKIRFQKRSVELATVVAIAVEARRPIIEARKQKLTVSLAPNLWLEADPTRLAQIVGNLLDNATKYTAEGGQIDLTTARDGGEVVLRVKDNGIGIPPEMLPGIFDPFVQAEHSLGFSQGGLGLGLSLVRSLVEMHGGIIAASSPGAGRGSEFVVSLPALPKAEQGPRGAPVPLMSGLSPSRRILVVDDNIDAAASLAMLLKLIGHNVRTVHTGLAVLEAARSFQPEVVLLDIGLPGVNGYDLAPQLRGEAGLEGVQLVAVMGYAQEAERQRAREAKFDAHLIRPVDPGELMVLLANGLPGALWGSVE